MNKCDFELSLLLWGKGAFVWERASKKGNALLKNLRVLKVSEGICRAEQSVTRHVAAAPPHQGPTELWHLPRRALPCHHITESRRPLHSAPPLGTGPPRPGSLRKGWWGTVRPGGPAWLRLCGLGPGFISWRPSEPPPSVTSRLPDLGRGSRLPLGPSRRRTRRSKMGPPGGEQGRPQPGPARCPACSGNGQLQLLRWLLGPSEPGSPGQRERR